MSLSQLTHHLTTSTSQLGRLWRRVSFSEPDSAPHTEDDPTRERRSNSIYGYETFAHAFEAFVSGHHVHSGVPLKYQRGPSEDFETEGRSRSSNSPPSSTAGAAAAAAAGASAGGVKSEEDDKEDEDERASFITKRWTAVEGSVRRRSEFSFCFVCFRAVFAAPLISSLSQLSNCIL
jgi:hypothetical protein